MQEEIDRLLLLVAAQQEEIRFVSTLAGRNGWRTVTAPDGDRALVALGEQPHNAIIVDQRAAGEDFCGLVARLRGQCANVPILVLTDSASPLLAVEAMRAGATDYLVRPVGHDRLLRALESTIEYHSASPELASLAEKIDEPLDFDMMIGSAPKIRASLAKAAKAARGHGPMLIAGEPGSGKEILVRAIHSASPRARAVLRITHIAGLAPGHVESALYGHERHAFPGAFDRRDGALQLAEGGTLVIDDIEQMPLKVQQRLAVTATTGEVRPIGASHAYRIDVRIIGSTSAPLERLAQEGKFDAELFAKLSSTTIALPPLRERKGDIPALIRHFLTRIGEKPGLRRLGITDDAIAMLCEYDWPGNLSQLQAVLFRAAVFCDANALTSDDFPNLSTLLGDSLPTSRAPSSGGVMLFAADGHLRSLDEIEADVIRLAIGHYHGRMSEVARRLGIGRSTLYRKLADLGIDNAA